MYVDVGGENAESLWDIGMPLDHVDGVWAQTLCSPLCTHDSVLPWSLSEDLKFYEQKSISPLQILTKEFNKEYKNNIYMHFKVLISSYLSRIQASLWAHH